MLSEPLSFHHIFSSLLKTKEIITSDESRTMDDVGITVVSLRDWLLSL